ncbi:MAG TPA: C4-type zinc ribbon domain-containing protein [Candidatus Acidoferrales bacterium]|nr:C4-type zinc ribbon domain-containing protein [Candidatus Acidoferrales bacterium]
MQKVLQNLLDLQSIDARRNIVRGQLALFPRKIAEIEARVAAARAAVEHAKAAQLASFKDRKKYELDVEQSRERVRKYKDQMSLVKTNEAYKALQHEVQMAEAEIAKAEDRLLEQMVAGEVYDQRIKSADNDRKEIEQASDRERSRIQTEKAAADKELATVEAERARVVAQIPENLLDHYERIARKHNGVSLAEVHNGKCGACGMIVRPHVLQEMRRANSEEMFHCETCTRILYYVEPEASAAGASATSISPASAAAVPPEN